MDAPKLPHVAGRFDVVIANHMLYHVPDRVSALGEMARVLTPGGRFYAITIGEGHMRELATLATAVAPKVDVYRGFSPERFSLENAVEQVATTLQGVTLRRYPDELRITAVEPLLAYYRSLGLDDLASHMEQLRAHLQHILDVKGVITITKDSGMILAHRLDEEEPHE